MATATTKQIMMMPARGDSNSAKALPVFLVKLVTMLEDKALNNVICWDNSGHSFHIMDSSAFCNEVLPQYFKHKNLNSFVRQLNFYGFRKLVSVDKTSLCYMKTSGEDLHFMHPKFVRGYPDLMFEIKRQTNPTKKLTAAVPKQQTIEAPQDENDDSMTTIANRDLISMMSELSLLRQKTDDLECMVDSLNRSHDILWQEMRILRDTNAKQSDCFNKLIQFLISVMPANKRVARRQRPFVEADNMIVASRHGCDVLACIQQELHESADLSKQSVFEENDTKQDDTSNGYELTFDGSNIANPLSVIQQRTQPLNNQQLLPFSPTKMLQPKKVEIISCKPTTSYDTSYDRIQNRDRQEHIFHPISPMMPDESLLEEIDKNNLLDNQEFMEYFEGNSNHGNNEFETLLGETEWDNLMELSPTSQQLQQ